MADPIDNIPRPESAVPRVDRPALDIAGRSRTQLDSGADASVRQGFATSEQRLPPAPLPGADAARVLAEQLNDLPVLQDRGIRFDVNEAAGKTVISVVDRSSGEQLRQIPYEAVVVLAEKLRAFNQGSGDFALDAGQFIDEMI